MIFRKDPAAVREAEIEKVKKRLLRDRAPRLQVSVMLLFTAFGGFLASFLMLRAGIDSMALRYPIAIAFAYCVFLLCLRIWIWLNDPRASRGPSIDIPGDLPVPNISVGGSSPAVDAEPFFGGGADFAGAGAGGSWDEGGNVAPVAFASSTKTSSGGGLGIGSAFDADLDELIFLIIAIVALAAAFSVLIYIIWIAPLLLAELMVDGVLVAGLYRKVKGIEPQYWLITAVKRTIIPFVIVVLMFTLAGWALQSAAPEARTIGEAIRMI